MILPERFAALLGHRVVRLAGGAIAAGAGLAFCALTYRVSEQHAHVLQREIVSLQLAQLADRILVQSTQLAVVARELAGSERVVQVLDDGASAAPVNTAALAEIVQFPIDGVMLMNAAQVVRYSASVEAAQYTERPADPAVVAYLKGVAAARLQNAGPDSAGTVGFAAGRLVAVLPVTARGGAGNFLGWVVATRDLRSAMLAGQSVSTHTVLEGGEFRPADLADLPAALRTTLVAPHRNGFGVTTHVTGEESGYAIVHDGAGRPVWLFHLVYSRRDAVPAPNGPSHPVASDLPPSIVFTALGGVLCAAAFLGLRGYLRRQRSVDARYKAIIDQTNDGIVIVDASTHQVQYCNPAFLTRLGYTSDDAAALTLRDIFADGTSSTESVLARLRNADSKLALNIQQRCKGGALIDIEVRCNTLDVDGRHVLAYVTHDVSVRRKAEQQLIDNQQRLDRMAHHDQLTGLPNRHYLASFLPDAIAVAKEGNTMLGVVFLDLDRFKHINDTRGHETGDKLLQEVGGRLRGCVRDTDVVIRMGGDEFVVIFRHVKSYDEVTQGAGRIINSLNRPIVIDHHPLQTTGSVGVSVFPRDGSNMEELLKHSDTAMYQAKDRGRNNVQMFSPIMNRKLKHRVAMEASLREALRLRQFDVHYQPFVHLPTRKVVGLEALMRWRHPEHGMIPADEFIPVAEETGLIVPMGNFVLHRTLQTMSAWRKAGVALVPVSLNVAPAQLQRGDFQATISTLLKTHGLKPEMLQLEMTERAVFDSNQSKAGENQQDTMGRLRDLGIKIAIDDFGTGYSSLSYLKNWRVDALKIDRSFVRDLVTDSSDLAIVSAIIAIARHLNIQVIAEGIEAYQQADLLQKLGCLVGQGYLFARPLPAEECVKLLGDTQGKSAPEEEEDMLAVFASGRA